MKTVDFKHFKMFCDISQEKTRELDIRREFADFIYTRASGIVAHDLALRIYRSEEPVEISEEDEAILNSISRQGTPMFIDSFQANILCQEKK